MPLEILENLKQPDDDKTYRNMHVVDAINAIYDNIRLTAQPQYTAYGDWYPTQGYNAGNTTYYI